MFDTTFGFNSSFNQYELKIDGSKLDATIAWLNKFQVKFNVTAFSRYVLIEIIKASDAVIDTLTAKFCPTPKASECEPVSSSDLLDSVVSMSQYVSYFKGCNTKAEIKAQYKTLAKSMHPDAGGNDLSFLILNYQYNNALDALKVHA